MIINPAYHKILTWIYDGKPYKYVETEISINFIDPSYRHDEIMDLNLGSWSFISVSKSLIRQDKDIVKNFICHAIDIVNCMDIVSQ